MYYVVFLYRSGYSLLLDGRTCADIDECKDNPRICNGGKCSNILGSYNCYCTDGLIPGSGGTSCLGMTMFMVSVHGRIKLGLLQT